ncbi:hypothetical protein KBD34_00070 [Patescibacteria group bacterium]|nr:hypothetical protein [Patescibacteria group bacterium]
MTRYVIALFSRTFPQPLPQTWRLVWRTHLADFLRWLIAGFLFVLPWFVVPHWRDGVELPKALLGLGAMSLWIVARAAYSLLGQATERRWSVFSLWVGLLAIVVSISCLLSPHRALSWLGNGYQIASSLSVLLLALWLAAAVRDSVERRPAAARFFVWSWILGSVSAIVYALLTLSARLDALLLIPLVFLSGLFLLATRPVVSEALTGMSLTLYRASHGFLALILVGLLALGLLLPLGSLWIVPLVGTVFALPLLFIKQKKLTLAGFVATAGIASALVGLVLNSTAATPAWITQGRQSLHLERLSEILPTQTLTWQIASKALEDKPLFGVGPGGWSYAFDQFRPQEFNATPFWNVRFSRSASALATGLVEYGLIPFLLVLAFFLVSIFRALRRVRQTKDSALLWEIILCLSALGFAALHPLGIEALLATALLFGLLSAKAFVPGEQVVPGSRTPFFARSLFVAGTLCALCLFIFSLQRAAAAELLTRPSLYAFRLAIKLNSADDRSPQREALSYLQQARLAKERNQPTVMSALLQEAERSLDVALARNPRDVEHWFLALELAKLEAELDVSKDRAIFEAVRTIDWLRPNDPAASLALFSVSRDRMARESRWVEQGQGREKEEAIQRESQERVLANDALIEALRRKEDYLPALYAKAAWLAQTGQLKDAIASLESLQASQPITPELSLPLAMLYRRNQEPNKAMEVLLRLVEQAPRVPEYQWQLALAAVQAERWEEAMVVLQRLVATVPQETLYQTQLKDVMRKRAQTMTPTIPTATSTLITASSTTSTPAVPVKRAPVRRRTTRPTT